MPHGPSCDTSGFAISGTRNASLSGIYAQIAHDCEGQPVYQKGGSGGLMLYRYGGHTGRGTQQWLVGSNATDCVGSAPLYLGSYNGGCPASPAGAGCTGKWDEWLPGTGGVPNPAVKVAAVHSGEICDHSTGCDASPDCGHGSCVA